MEKSVPVDGVESVSGVLAIEGRGVDNNSKPMVEVLDGQTTGAYPSADKLKTISNKIRGVELGKISIQGRSRVGSASGYYEEDTSRTPNGIHDDGQSSYAENITIYGTRDQWHSANKGNTGTDGGDQTLNNSLQRGVGVEDGAFGSMEVEGQ